MINTQAHTRNSAQQATQQTLAQQFRTHNAAAQVEPRSSAQVAPHSSAQVAPHSSAQQAISQQTNAAQTAPASAQTTAHPHLREHHDVGEEKPLLEFKDFCFAYENHAVLRHIDLHIHAGDSVVLMGDNGSGKSTLLKAINGLIFPAQGTYEFDGELVSERSMKNAKFSKLLHQRIGYIFQDSDAQLFCASVEDEIAFGPMQMGLSQAEVERRVADVAALIGIENLLTRAPYNLSGGEKKKVALACIVSMNPDVYCFDEPLNGLDQRTRTWLIDFLRQLKSAGKTLIIATHDQSLADELASYFVFMGEGHGYVDKPHIHINKRV